MLLFTLRYLKYFFLNLVTKHKLTIVFLKNLTVVEILKFVKSTMAHPIWQKIKIFRNQDFYHRFKLRKKPIVTCRGWTEKNITSITGSHGYTAECYDVLTATRTTAWAHRTTRAVGYIPQRTICTSFYSNIGKSKLSYHCISCVKIPYYFRHIDNNL